MRKLPSPECKQSRMCDRVRQVLDVKLPFDERELLEQSLAHMK